MGESIHDPPPQDPGTPPPARAVGDSNIFSDVPTIGPGAGLVGGAREKEETPLGEALPSWAAAVAPGMSGLGTAPAPSAPPAEAPTAPPAEGVAEEAAPWSGWSPDAEPADTHDGQTEEDLEPTGPLPPPLGRRGFPLGALTAALLEAIFLGIILAVVRRMLFVPLVFHMVAGIALGWALGGVAKRGASGGALVLVTVIATLLMCTTMFGFLYVCDRHPHLFTEFDAGEVARLFTPAVFERFQSYVGAQASDLRVYGFRPGKTGAYLLWLAEIVAAGAFAWFAVRSATRLSLTSSVPVEVLELVVGLRRQGRSPAEINSALIDGGWIDPSDQAAAQAAAEAYLSLLPARKRR